MVEEAANSSNASVIQNPVGRSTTNTNNHLAIGLKKKRNLPGTPDPDAEVIALSPETLMATNRFLCEICGKGFQRDQNLQLHRRGHNLPWKLKQRSSKEPRKRVYVCPENTCVHHHPSRALGDLTGIKKHFCRKHGEKKWKCDKCSKRYAVQSDWKAHSKTCGTREYRCDCGTLFSRRDSFITHRAFCDALAEETARVNNAASNINLAANFNHVNMMMPSPNMPLLQHLSTTTSGLKQVPTIADHRQSKHGSLSLWMNQSIINHHAFDGDHFTFSSDTYPVVPINNMITSSVLPLISNMKDVGGPLAPLFSTQNQNHYSIISNSTSTTHAAAGIVLPSSSVASMSATALLQKAAQIGATTSTDPSLMVQSIYDGSKANNINMNNVQDGDNYNYFGLLYPSNTNTTTTNDDDGHVETSDTSTTMNDPILYPMAKRQRRDGGAAGGEITRDFLGVGVQTNICHPSSVNGWI